MSKAKELLGSCASFEWRGLVTASLVQVTGSSVTIVRKETDWSDITQGKPLVDRRNGAMADLLPKPKAMMERFLSGLSSGADEAPKPKGPRL